MNYGVDVDYLNEEEVAELLAVSSEVIVKYLYDGELEGVELGEEWRIEVGDLKEFISKLKEDKEEELKFKDQQAIEVDPNWTLDECGHCGELRMMNIELSPFCSVECRDAVDFGVQSL
ncbi:MULTISPECIES: excisionase family DNA-binding protein [unclassified Candidatus Frackibacter]|uniref:excisionase family DNA-binding protein n=1 Tax=unclassified Candidatus Frackibacter TaxID=2648818 RepID=UPI000794E08B|nr:MULTISPECIES: helix-turn-helix domain-containing protein [unclassified Candidatus Frackibacter]KXS42544.1 MAG: hypothetical protein AWU54_1285 [Candidatus Frackibacter sp. T328-2]SDC30670.1 DNA binding domain-containing protein, excisionase family [Candidatus Frackibacter sp. WG11]SEM74068.1 DNA binding domain-containing protein, excisionase family [Candidatus Frackibacter sp. WG12]SFL58508.1 DNA binding domain-containing protein, excisionase family [Candidatus Frackibacter sp. WG13]